MITNALMEKQIELELEMHGSGIERFYRNNDRHMMAEKASETDWSRRIITQLVDPMAAGIVAYFEFYKTKRGTKPRALSLINKTTPHKAAYIAIKIILDVIGSNKFDANWLVTCIGRRVEDQVRFSHLEESAPKYIARIKESMAQRGSMDYDHQHKVLVSTEKKLAEEAEREAELQRWVSWDEADCKHVGAVLVSIFEKSVTFEGQPIIRREVQAVAGKGTLTYVKPCDNIVSWIERYKEAVSGMAPTYAPCVVPPKPWTSPFTGGYYTDELQSSLTLVKQRNKKHLRKLTPQQMPRVYKAVNFMQNVGWQVSERVLSTANTLVELGLPYALPSREADDWKSANPCPVPENLSGLRGEDLKAALTTKEWQQFQDWKFTAREKYDEEAERVSDFREVVRTLGQANQYVKFDQFYFVYTTDFRGRVYTQSSLLSPQGGDLQKGLIKFSEGLPLGKGDGEFWFKVHGANVWGWDKKPLETRCLNVEEESFIEMCLDIADDPVTFNDWVNADTPWQFLNWCFEYADFIKHIRAGNEAANFVSYIPCAMDGSCSGIQHYSMMLRDEVGGAAVNLRPSEQPNDIYRTVLEVAMRKVEGLYKDPETYNGKIPMEHIKPIANEWIRLQPNRSLTKKSVMTLPYGSTQMTCREHVQSWLRDLQKEENKLAKAEVREPNKAFFFGDADSDMPLKEAVSFMSSIIWSSIGEVVIAARAAMKFIKAVTSVVAKMNKPLIFTAPTGFIVYQEIFEMKVNRVETQLMGASKFTMLEPTKKIDYHRMMNSSAPNFVHTHDAAHLVWATNGVEDEGIISLALIHDSFGCHACNTTKLNEILRSSAVEMYEEHDVISNFLYEQEDRLEMAIETAVLPERGNLNLNELLESKYAFA